MHLFINWHTLEWYTCLWFSLHMTTKKLTILSKHNQWPLSPSHLLLNRVHIVPSKVLQRLTRRHFYTLQQLEHRWYQGSLLSDHQWYIIYATSPVEIIEYRQILQKMSFMSLKISTYELIVNGYTSPSTHSPVSKSKISKRFKNAFNLSGDVHKVSIWKPTSVKRCGG